MRCACYVCLVLQRPVASLYCTRKLFLVVPQHSHSIGPALKAFHGQQQIPANYLPLHHGSFMEWSNLGKVRRLHTPIVSSSNCRTCSARSDENTIEYLKIVNQGLPDAKKFIRRVLSSTQIFIKKDSHTQVGQFLRARADELQFDEEDNLEEQD